MLIIIVLALSLSLDALGVGVSYGIKKITIPFIAKCIIFIVALIITFISILFGNIIGKFLDPIVFKYLGIGMIFFMGLAIICQVFEKEKIKDKKVLKEGTILNLIIKSYGITIKIIRDPKSGDMNNSNVIEPLEALYIGIALSIDAIGVSFASSSFSINNYFVPFFVALFQVLFLSFGDFIGHKFYKKPTNSKSWLFISGCLLIVIALFRVFGV